MIKKQKTKSKMIPVEKADSNQDYFLGIQSISSDLPPADIEEVFELDEVGNVFSHTIIDHSKSERSEDDFAKPND